MTKVGLILAYLTPAIAFAQAANSAAADKNLVCTTQAYGTAFKTSDMSPFAKGSIKALADITVVTAADCYAHALDEARTQFAEMYQGNITDGFLIKTQATIFTAVRWHVNDGRFFNTSGSVTARSSDQYKSGDANVFFNPKSEQNHDSWGEPVTNESRHTMVPPRFLIIE